MSLSDWILFGFCFTFWVVVWFYGRKVVNEIGHRKNH